MIPKRLRRAFVIATAIAMACIGVGSRTELYDLWRERAFDALPQNLPLPSPETPLVIDIDRRSLAELGPWPWRREQFVRLIDGIVAQRPRALAIDILFDKPDALSPAFISERLAADGAAPDLLHLAESIPDWDKALASAIGRAKTVLGVALDPERSGDKIKVPALLVRGGIDLTAIWRSAGVIAPITPLRTASSGLGVMALPSDGDAVVRRVPLLTASQSQIVPGLAVELVRIAKDAGSLVLTSVPSTLRIGDAIVPVGPDAMLRLLPALRERWPARTISAIDLLKQPMAPVPALAGRAVLVGSSAPELGGLRVAAGAHLVPGVQLQADAATQIMSGAVSRRPANLQIIELLVAAIAAAGGIWTGLTQSPARGMLTALVIAAGWFALCVVAAFKHRILIDPLLPVLAVGVCFLATALLHAADTARRAAAIRRRFEQHLAPEVVRRIVECPNMLKLAGESRVVTSLFTDVEGFTALTERTEPIVLVGLLDRYFSSLSQIIVDHGGMIDKIVGDAVHAIFNAPLDLDHHVGKAVACAEAIHHFSCRFMHEPLAASCSFGRTRYGIETGLAIVGDIGGGRKLDYTAHGNVINTAARLEAANKDLGSTICIGPGAAANLPLYQLRPLGVVSLPGRSRPQAVFEPWPEAYTPQLRADYMAAFELASTDPTTAAARLEALGKRLATDPVPSVLAMRLRRVGDAAVVVQTTEIISACV